MSRVHAWQVAIAVWLKGWGGGKYKLLEHLSQEGGATAPFDPPSYPSFLPSDELRILIPVLIYN